MNRTFPQPHHMHERLPSNENRPSFECPRCEAAISRDDHHCTKCGAELIVCYRCKSPNVGHAQFCHMCGQPMIRSSLPNEITVASKARDFDILDHAALAIVKLREIIESIERLELAHQIACPQSTPIRSERCS